MDLILGRFFSATSDELSENEISLLDKLLEHDDHEITAWLFRYESEPKKFTNILKKIRDFNLI